MDYENGAGALHNTGPWWLEGRELRCIVPGTCPGVMGRPQRYRWCPYLSSFNGKESPQMFGEKLQT
jgi:hypothetical protein